MPDIPSYDDLLGKPFAYGGRGPESYDCYGLAREVCNRAGVLLPEWHSVCDAASIQEEFDAGRQLLVEIPVPQPLCLVLLMVHPPYVSHCGIMLDRIRMIHIMQSTSVAVERIDSLAWQRRVRGFYILRSGV